MREHKNISIADQIFEQLERDILSGKYPRSTVLSELGLSKELGVSRTPVREAIRRLEQEDILEECGKGMIVVGITPEDMQDMFEIRLAIEGEAARRAAMNISDEQLGRMREILDLQRFYSEKEGENSSDQIKNMDSQFHEILYLASDSRPYIRTLLPLHKRMMKMRKATGGARGHLRSPSPARPGRCGEGGAGPFPERPGENDRPGGVKPWKR